MVRLKERMLVTVLVVLLGSSSVAHTNLTQVFSACVGRFSAEREHAWLMRRADADSLDAQRLTFLSLLDATLAEDSAQQSLSYRIEVKVAHAHLLSVASFGHDARRAEQARTLAATYLSGCQRLLLDS